MRRPPPIIFVLTAAAALMLWPQRAPGGIEDSNYPGDIEAEPIAYSATAPDDPVARLQRRIDAGEARLDYEGRHGYLRSLLRELKVDIASQVLVFSKTSLQLKKISPHRPRAIYFNDDTYIGWVRGGEVVEIAAVDPRLGPIFYTLEQKPATPGAPGAPGLPGAPRFRRDVSCLQCHSSGRTQGVPGLIVRSVYVDGDGRPTITAGGYTTDHRSPLVERWGGWYVTGTHGRQRHMGNVFVRDPLQPETLDIDFGANVTDLSPFFDTSAYLTPHSDIVALMVLEHQVRMQNLLTRAGFEVRTALHYQASIDAALGRPAGELSEQNQRRIQEAGDAILRYMLLLDEEILEDKIDGTSGFAEWFSAQGPADRHGRSLRQIRLNKSIFRHPCSHMIHSPSFDAPPAVLKEYIYRRLHQVLTGAEESTPWSNLSATSRTAILEILQDTKPDLPDYFRAAPGE